jgi:hypothetical protein
MKQLVLRNKTYEIAYRVIGLVMLVLLIIVLALSDPKAWSFWFNSVLLILLALTFLTLNFGTLVNRLIVDEGVLTIRWYSKAARIKVNIDEIDEIKADENYITMRQKNGRTVRLPTRMLESEEKRAVRKFLKEVTGF